MCRWGRALDSIIICVSKVFGTVLVGVPEQKGMMS